MSRANEHAPLLAQSREGRDTQARYGGVASQDDGSAEPTSSSEPAPSAHGETDVPFPPLRVLLPLLFTIWVPVFAASLDGTVVATLVGSIASDFEASEQAAWLGSSYLLSVCCFTPIYGRLCDIIGRRRALLTALSFFVVGTFGCGMAQSMGQLIAARALAGVGGGGLAVVNGTIMSDVIPLRQRGLMQGLTNIIFGLGSGLGGPVGGFANDKLGWRSAFMLQMPILGIALVAALFVPLSPPNQRPSPLAGLSWTDKLLLIDGLGSLFLVGAVGSSLISLSLMSAQDLSFSEPVGWGGLLGGAASAAAFVCVELWVARKPILPIPLLLQRTGGSVAIANFALAVMSFALLYNFPLWFMTVKMQTAREAGLHLIPQSVALSVSSVTAGLYMRWRGVYWAYNLFHAVLMLLGSLTVLSFTADTPEWLTYAGVVPSGFGVSGVLTCTLIALINSVPREDIAVATAMSYLFRTSGQVVGVALSGAILQAKLRVELEKRISGPGAAKTIAAIRHQSSIIPTLPAHERAAAVAAYAVALRWVFGFVAAAALVTLLSSITIENRTLPEHSKASNDTEQPDGTRDT